ncbi:MAG: Abi family protein [Desulfobacteraceae bacterium]|nr:Abi family protein [Desulfobacteraceae bacterium]
MEYQKKPSSIDEQYHKLISRGLKVTDPDRVKRYLRYVSYCRLSKYFLPFYQKNRGGRKIFKENTPFDHILKLYIFDRKLRLIVMDAIERIEVAIRSIISNTLCKEYGAHWFYRKDIFRNSFEYDKLIDDITEATGRYKEHKRNKSCTDYFKKYDLPELPPAWIVAEVLYLGKWVWIYKNLKKEQDKADIADFINLSSELMESWIASLNDTRNLCAHHSRLWNRTFKEKPVSPNFERYSHILDFSKNDTKFYAQAVLLDVFLTSMLNNSRWKEKLFNLFSDYQEIVKISKMGFQSNWQEDPFWGEDVRYPYHQIIISVSSQAETAHSF